MEKLEELMLEIKEHLREKNQQIEKNILEFQNNIESLQTLKQQII